MSNKSHGGVRPGAGRPPLPEEERYVKMYISVAPDQARWLRNQPEGISPTIQRLIQKERNMYPEMKINAFYGAKVYGDNGREIGTLPHRTKVEVIEPFTKPWRHTGEFVKVTDGEMTGHVHASNVIETDAVE